jgi:hypothetical protein
MLIRYQHMSMNIIELISNDIVLSDAQQNFLDQSQLE